MKRKEKNIKCDIKSKNEGRQKTNAAEKEKKNELRKK